MNAFIRCYCIAAAAAAATDDDDDDDDEMWYLCGDSGGSGQDESIGRPVGGSGGPLLLIVSLLTSSPISLDLNALTDLLQLAGTLFAGLLILTSSSKKVKFSHTRYRALGPVLILVYRHSARR